MATTLKPILSLVFVCLLLSCSSEQAEAQGTDTIITHHPEATLVVGGIDIPSLKIGADGTAVAFNKSIQQLRNWTGKGHILYLHGENPKSAQLFCHPFMGYYEITLLNDSTFRFNGTEYWPNTGLWEDGFSKQEYFSFHLIINNNGWRIEDIAFPKLNLQPAHPDIDSLRDRLDENPVCSSKDWDEAVSCFPLIEQYEFALFAAVVIGDTSRIDEYLDLQQNFDLAHAGEFAEYYAGNLYYLFSREILSPELLKTKASLRRQFWLHKVYGSWE